MHRRSGILIAVVLAVGPLAACRGGDDTGSTATTAASVTTTTTEAATPTSEAATTTTPAAADLVLRGDGLGVVALGAGPEEALAAVSAVLGGPTADTGWGSSFGPYGTCPGERVRGVEWDHLVLLFADGETSYGTGQHLFAWRITGAPPALGTAAGFGYRATIADAEDLYPGAFEVVPPEDPFPGFLQIAAEGGTITAYLDEAGTVTNLEAGVACGE
jgi:hypothetical protein